VRSATGNERNHLVIASVKMEFVGGSWRSSWVYFPDLCCERSVIAPDGISYRLSVHRRGVPSSGGGFFGLVALAVGSVTFLVQSARGRGYRLELSRSRPAQPGSWTRWRPLPAEQTVVIGPFRTLAEARAEGDRVAAAVERGAYPDAP